MPAATKAPFVLGLAILSAVALGIVLLRLHKKPEPLLSVGRSELMLLRPKELFLSAGQSQRIKMQPYDQVIINADFPLDNDHHLIIRNLTPIDIILTSQPGSTAWGPGSDMIIGGGTRGNNPFPSYNPGRYVLKLNHATSPAQLEIAVVTKSSGGS